MMRWLKKRLNQFYTCKLQEGENHFSVRGKNPHPIAFVPTGLGFIFLWGLLMTHGLDLAAILYGLGLVGKSLVPSVVLLFLYRFEIRVDTQEISIKEKFGPISFRTMKCPIQQLTLYQEGVGEINDIKLISPSENQVPSNSKSSIRLDYCTPFDGDTPELYTDYKDKFIHLSFFNAESAWECILKGLRNLDQKQSKTSF